MSHTTGPTPDERHLRNQAKMDDDYVWFVARIREETKLLIDRSCALVNVTSTNLPEVLHLTKLAEKSFLLGRFLALEGWERLCESDFFEIAHETRPIYETQSLGITRMRANTATDTRSQFPTTRDVRECTARLINRCALLCVPGAPAMAAELGATAQNHFQVGALLFFEACKFAEPAPSPSSAAERVWSVVPDCVKQKVQDLLTALLHTKDPELHACLARSILENTTRYTPEFWRDCSAVIDEHVRGQRRSVAGNTITQPEPL